MRKPVEILRDRWGVPHIYAQTLEDLFFAQGYITATDRLFQINLKASRILSLNSPLMEFLGVASFIPLLYHAHLRIREGTLTLGGFSGSLFSLFRMYDPIRKLSRIHIQFQRSFASAARIFELLDTRVEIQDRAGETREQEPRETWIECADQRDDIGVLLLQRGRRVRTTLIVVGQAHQDGGEIRRIVDEQCQIEQ